MDDPKPTVQDMATEVYSVTTTAISTAVSSANRPALPTYFNPACYPRLAALASPLLGPLLSEMAQEDMQLPSTAPPWLKALDELEEDNASDESDSEGGNSAADEDDAWRDADVASLSSGAMADIADLRSRLWQDDLAWRTGDSGPADGLPAYESDSQSLQGPGHSPDGYNGSAFRPSYDQYYGNSSEGRDPTLF